MFSVFLSLFSLISFTLALFLVSFFFSSPSPSCTHLCFFLFNISFQKEEGKLDMISDHMILICVLALCIHFFILSPLISISFPQLIFLLFSVKFCFSSNFFSICRVCCLSCFVHSHLMLCPSLSSPLLPILYPFPLTPPSCFLTFSSSCFPLSWFMHYINSSFAFSSSVDSPFPLLTLYFLNLRLTFFYFLLPILHFLHPLIHFL